MTASIEGMLTIWYLLTAGALIFLIWDLFTNTPAGGVMKLAWVLVVLYTGPIGLFIYLLSCRQPLPGTHDAFIKAHWKQATGSLLHCVAGDATGIIISAAIVYHFRLPNGIDLIVEYLAAFIVGLFVFQALFMLPMYNGNYRLAVHKTFFVETVSMNMVMVGMIPTMMILMHALPRANDPLHVTFWGVMSVATIAGMITAYPINSWMVALGLKHGMMSAVPEVRKTEAMDMSTGVVEKMTMSHEMQHDHKPAEMPEGEMNMSPGKGHRHHGASLSKAKTLTVFVGTFALLAIVIWITSLFVPLTLGLGG